MALRIGLVWAGSSRLTDISVRYERFVLGLETLGHLPQVIAPAETLEGFVGPSLPCRREDLADRRFWHQLGLDAAIIINWLALPEILAAIQAEVPAVVALADSDGLVGARAFPRQTWKRTIAQHRDAVTKLKAAKYWLQQYLYDYKRVDAPKLRAAECADAIVVPCEQAVGNLRHFFACHGRDADLGPKVVAVPYPVDGVFLTGPVPEQRQDRLVAVGRWDDPQKDGRLLFCTLRLVVRLRPSVEALIYGPAGERWFGGKQWAGSKVRYMGVHPPADIAAALRSSRSLVVSSRWEGAPVVVNEALASGCTLVGPAEVPALSSVCRQGPYGTLFARRSARCFAAAVVAELEAWDRGHRHPRQIAEFWRPHFDPVRVCQQLVTLCASSGAGRHACLSPGERDPVEL
jgi:hypothetical protein